MKKNIFIINPEAGKKKGSELVGFIRRNFKKVTVLKTEYPGHATELAKEYAGINTNIYSVGGDGTLNEVVNGVLQSGFALETAVAAVPCGSGNDFIKGITSLKEPIKLLEAYKEENTIISDVGYINGRSFINISSMGFDAEIVLGAKKYKRLPLVSSEMAYLISVFATLIKLKGYPVKVKVDDEEFVDINALFIIMANGSYYGGGMNAAPKAELDDGLFDFYFVDKVPKWKVPFLLPKFMKGKHEQLKVVKPARGMKMLITSEKPVPLNIDGEVELNDNIEVEIHKAAIKLLVP